jgi:hypothetical protein
MNNTPLTYNAVLNVFNYLAYEKHDLDTANTFKSALVSLDSLEIAPDRKAKMAEAVRALNDTGRMLRYYDAPNINIGHAITNLTIEGSDLVKRVAGICKANLGSLIKDLRQAMQGHDLGDLSYRPSVAQLRVQPKEADQSNPLCNGFMGLYEMVTMRPYLASKLQNQGQESRFLATLARDASTVVHSFSERRDGKTREEGVAMFGKLIKLLSSNRESLKDCCTADTLDFIDQVILTNEDSVAQAKVYDQLRDAIRAECRTSCTSFAMGKDDLLEFCGQKATEISATITSAMKGEAGVANLIIAGFREQQDHGQGARLHGVEGIHNFYSDMFGSGIRDHRSFAVPIDPFNDMSTHKVDEKARAKTRALAEQTVRDYYKNCQLATAGSRESGSSTETTTLTSTGLALGTVSEVISYEIMKHRERTLMFGGLDPAQRAKIGQQVAPKVVLHGLRNNMFNGMQIDALLARYPFLRENQEIMTAAGGVEAQNRRTIEGLSRTLGLLGQLGVSKETQDTMKERPHGNDDSKG